MALVKAKWIGPSGYAIQAGTVEEGDDTFWLVPEDEARVSTHWELAEQSPSLTPEPRLRGGTE